MHYVVDPVIDAASSLAALVGAQVAEPEVVFSDDAIDAVVSCSATPTHSDLIREEPDGRHGGILRKAD